MGALKSRVYSFFAVQQYIGFIKYRSAPIGGSWQMKP
jgi:hypothetical protein